MAFPQSSFARTGRFDEIYPVGRGAVGQVYSARDNLGRRVAVKEALPAAEGFAAFRAKFEKESRLQAALDHPNIVRVHHLEEDPETRELYLICEYADAGSLAELIEREGPLPEPRAIRLALDLCAALEETERRRIVHRDLKPSNILLFTQPGGELTAKLGDFGIAQDTRQRKTTMLPGTGHPGTPLYMAPEQADVTLIVDTRADIFALGVTLWEMLTGEDYKALLRDGAAPTLATYNPTASPRIAQVIARAVRADREQRYQTPREFADDLRRVLQGERPAPATTRLRAPLGRRAPVATHPRAPFGHVAPAPITRLNPSGFFGLSMGLMLAVGLAMFIVLGALGLFTGSNTSTFEPTALPPPMTATPVPAALGDEVFLNLDQTATPVPFEPAVALQPQPTPWVEGTAMAGPNGCRAGSGRLVSEDRPATGVRAVLLEGVGTLEVRQGAVEALTVSGDDNLIQMIYSYVDGEQLVIGLNGCVREAAGLRYSLTVRDLRAVTIAGAGEATLADINSESLTLLISGTGTIDASGLARTLSVEISGSGEVRGQPLASEDAQVRIGGTGNVAVRARDTLDVQIAGAGTVVYFGSPALTEAISGVGEVQGLGAP